MERPETERAVGYLVKRVQQSFRRRSDAALRSTGVSMAQYAVLRALADHPSASASELSRLCFVTRQSLQDVLTGLRSAGLITESGEQLRGRAISLELTAAGARRLTAAHAAVIGVESMMLQTISPSARRQVVTTLIRCAENLETG